MFHTFTSISWSFYVKFVGAAVGSESDPRHRYRIDCRNQQRYARSTHIVQRQNALYQKTKVQTGSYPHTSHIFSILNLFFEQFSIWTLITRLVAFSFRFNIFLHPFLNNVKKQNSVKVRSSRSRYSRRSTICNRHPLPLLRQLNRTFLFLYSQQATRFILKSFLTPVFRRNMLSWRSRKLVLRSYVK